MTLTTAPTTVLYTFHCTNVSQLLHLKPESKEQVQLYQTKFLINCYWEAETSRKVEFHELDIISPSLLQSPRSHHPIELIRKLYNVLDLQKQLTLKIFSVAAALILRQIFSSFSLIRHDPLVQPSSFGRELYRQDTAPPTVRWILGSCPFYCNKEYLTGELNHCESVIWEVAQWCTHLQPWPHIRLIQGTVSSPKTTQSISVFLIWFKAFAKNLIGLLENFIWWGAKKKKDSHKSF